MERVLAIGSVLAVFGVTMLLARIYVRRRFDVVFLALLLNGFWFVFRSATPDYLFPEGHLQLVLLAEAGALVWLAGFGLGAGVGGAFGGPVAALLPRLRGEPSPIFVMAGLAAVTALAGAVTFWLFAASGGGLAESMRFVKAEKAVVGFYFLRQFAVVGGLLSIFAVDYLSYLKRVRMVAAPG